MYTRNRKRLNFPPGFISLAVLPVLLILFLKQNRVFQTDHCIQITFPLRDTGTILKNNFYRLTTGYIRKHKKWDDVIYLTGNKEIDKEKLQDFKTKIRNIVNANDTVHGACIMYHDKTKFKTFIDLVNICQTDRIRCYVGTDDAFYAWTVIDEWKLTTYKEIEIFGCGGSYSTYNEELPYERAERLEKEAHHRNFLLNQWPLFLFFLPVLWLSIPYMKKSK